MTDNGGANPSPLSGDASNGPQARKVNPRARWLRTSQIIATPGTSDRQVIAITIPISVWKVNIALIAMVIGLPAVTVRMRANTTSTQLKIKQKNAATPMPGEPAPLIGVNRAFVRQGLKVMARRDRPGLRALSDIAKLRTR